MIGHNAARTCTTFRFGRLTAVYLTRSCPPKVLKMVSMVDATASLDLNHGRNSANLPAMSTVKEIESAITKLSVEEMQSIRDWLEDFIEDQLEVSDAFKAKIARAKQEIAGGTHSRVRQPDSGE